MNSNHTVYAHEFTVQETKFTIYALFTKLTPILFKNNNNNNNRSAKMAKYHQFLKYFTQKYYFEKI